MTEQEMHYHEAMAALPAYAAGILNAERQAAVDAYLQRQIELFQRLDELEEVVGVANPANAKRLQGERQSIGEESFARVMEGQTADQRIPGNPLLMRKSPQIYTDRRTGQRFVVPKRGTLEPDSAPRAFPTTGPSWRARLGHTVWNLLALAAVVAILVISVYQINLQRQLTTTQAELALISTAENVIVLRGNPSDTTMQGTLFIHKQRALLTLSQAGPLPTGQIYQLWLTTSTGAQYPVALIAPSTNPAEQQLFVDLPVDGAMIVQAGLNTEPAGGSAQPTSAMVLTGHVSTE